MRKIVLGLVHIDHNRGSCLDAEKLTRGLVHLVERTLVVLRHVLRRITNDFAASRADATCLLPGDTHGLALELAVERIDCLLMLPVLLQGYLWNPSLPRTHVPQLFSCPTLIDVELENRQNSTLRFGVEFLALGPGGQLLQLLKTRSRGNL